VIRAAEMVDVARVASLIDRAYRGYVGALGRDPQPMTDDYHTLVSASEVWVYEHYGRIDGVLVLQSKDDHLLVRTIGIAPDRQRKGLGTKLMRHAEAVALASGQRQIQLYTNEVMTGNVELYERLGFVETHRTGPENKRVIYMTKAVVS
jgi:ribosomal protein S18 acetylase RimI-like enzyme